MSFFKRLFGGGDKTRKEEPKLSWIEASKNKWGVKVLDLRPVTQEMVATSANPQMATNASSYSKEDGTSFTGQEPPFSATITTDMQFPVDPVLAPGVLFIPRTMEHKWAIYFHGDTLIFVRSWLRQVMVTAATRQVNGKLVITSISGKFLEDESPAFTRQILKYLLVSHVLGEKVPAPLPLELRSSPDEAALWAFSMYGNMAFVGFFDEGYDYEVTHPLRSHSLLHIAVAQGDTDLIRQYVQRGFDVDGLAGDGLAPLHWSLASTDTSVIDTLLQLGATADVRSGEGATPLMNAVQSNKEEFVKRLLAAGADVNVRDNRGFTALHRAAEMGLVNMVVLLLENGGDRHAAVGEYTPLSLATLRGQQEVIQLLQP